MTGTLPTTFGSLTFLSSLELAYNQLTGNIDIIGTLTNLSLLDLLSNHFTGTIPTTIGSLTGLTWVNLAYNLFTGTIVC